MSVSPRLFGFAVAIATVFACDRSALPLTASATPATQPVTAVLRVDDVARAVDFYTDAFAAQTRLLLKNRDGTLEHAELSIAGVAIWVDRWAKNPTTLGGTSGGLQLNVEDPEARLRAITHRGAVVIGARTVRDPHGHVWRLGEAAANHPALEPFLVVARSADLGFYSRAFSARLERGRLTITDMTVKLEPVGSARDLRPPSQLGSAPFRIHVYVESCGRAFDHALSHGAEAIAEPRLMYWGDRWALVADPSGHEWGIGERVEKLTETEITDRLRRQN